MLVYRGYLDSDRSRTRSDAHFLSPRDLVTATAAIRAPCAARRRSDRSEAVDKEDAGCLYKVVHPQLCERWFINHIGIVQIYLPTIVIGVICTNLANELGHHLVQEVEGSRWPTKELEAAEELDVITARRRPSSLVVRDIDGYHGVHNGKEYLLWDYGILSIANLWDIMRIYRIYIIPMVSSAF